MANDTVNITELERRIKKVENLFWQEKDEYDAPSVLKVGELSFEPNYARDGAALGVRYAQFRISANTDGYLSVRDALAKNETDQLEVSYSEDGEDAMTGKAIEVWQDLHQPGEWWIKVEVALWS